MTLAQIQAMITNKGDQREIINELVDYIEANPSSPGAASYLVYTALLTQTGTNAPIVTVLENTLGGTVVWTRAALGYYTATLVGAFTVGKTVAVPFGSTVAPGSAFNFMGIGSGTPLEYAYAITQLSADAMSLEIYKASDYSSAELSSLQAAEQKLLIEFRVYP